MPNIQVDAQHCANNGRLSWAGPLLMLIARPAFAIAAQAVVAGVFYFRGEAKPWLSAAPWWTVYGTLIDIGCLLALTYLMRQERGDLRDLVGLQPERLRRNILDWLMRSGYCPLEFSEASLELCSSTGPPRRRYPQARCLY
jgi:hypothetical protein